MGTSTVWGCRPEVSLRIGPVTPRRCGPRPRRPPSDRARSTCRARRPCRREEVLDLVEQERGGRPDVLEGAVLRVSGISGRNTEHLVVATGLVMHPEHADGAHAHVASRERRRVEQHPHVKGIAVFGQGVRDEPVVGRVLRRGEERAVEPDRSGVVVHLVLVARPARDLRDHREVRRRVRRVVAHCLKPASTCRQRSGLLRYGA